MKTETGSQETPISGILSDLYVRLRTCELKRTKAQNEARTWEVAAQEIQEAIWDAEKRQNRLAGIKTSPPPNTE